MPLGRRVRAARQSRRLKHTGHNQARARRGPLAPGPQITGPGLDYAQCAPVCRGKSLSSASRDPGPETLTPRPTSNSSPLPAPRRRRRRESSRRATGGPRRPGRQIPASSSPDRTSGPVEVAPRSNPAPPRSSPLATRPSAGSASCIRSLLRQAVARSDRRCGWSPAGPGPGPRGPARPSP